MTAPASPPDARTRSYLFCNMSNRYCMLNPTQTHSVSDSWLLSTRSDPPIAIKSFYFCPVFCSLLPRSTEKVKSRLEFYKQTYPFPKGEKTLPQCFSNRSTRSIHSAFLTAFFILHFSFCILHFSFFILSRPDLKLSHFSSDSFRVQSSLQGALLLLSRHFRRNYRSGFPPPEGGNFYAAFLSSRWAASGVLYFRAICGRRVL